MLTLTQSRFEKYTDGGRFFDKKFLAISGVCFSILSGLTSWIIFDQYLKSREKKDNKNTQLVSTISRIQDPNPKIQQNLQTEIVQQNSEFFTPEKNEIIKNSFIIVVGQGGVGSHVTSSLVRSGIKKIRVIDFDQVTVSSQNR